MSRSQWDLDPFAYFNMFQAWMSFALAAQAMAQNASVVIMRRSMMMAEGKMKPSEAVRMTMEKPVAFAAAAQSAALAAVNGKDAPQIAAAALKPIARKAKANAHRLSSTRR